MAQDSAVTIIQRVSAEVGLPVSSAPFSDSDPNQILLIQLLNGAGIELGNYYEWPALDKTWTIDTDVDGTSASYALPSDFGWAHNGTFWNVTQQRTLGGPLTPQEWAAAHNSVTAGVGPLTEVFRQFGSNLEILPEPTSTATIYTLEYTSSNWVRKSGGTFAAIVTAPDDTVLIDSHVVSRLVKLRYLENKGMSTVPAMSEYQSALDDATFRPMGAPTLHISGSRLTRFLGYANIPETGYGS